eukprot:3126008-Prymnesium_polylepis.1
MIPNSRRRTAVVTGNDEHRASTDGKAAELSVLPSMSAKKHNQKYPKMRAWVAKKIRQRKLRAALKKSVGLDRADYVMKTIG